MEWNIDADEADDDDVLAAADEAAATAAAAAAAAAATAAAVELDELRVSGDDEVDEHVDEETVDR